MAPKEIQVGLAVEDVIAGSKPVIGSEHVEPEVSAAEKLYGPYPRAIPVPYLNKDHKTPPEEDIAAAKVYSDVKYADHRDKGTPDEWIPRDGRLVRLTGRHPFNVEPPLSVLNENRFLTPSCMHYVRNHGSCPKLSWDTHTLIVGGEVPDPQELGMDEIASMEAREIPVTLVCAGNRRKEQNMFRQTIGFNWGPSGVSTNVWKGPTVRDMLIKAGVSEKPSDWRGYHVEFIGIEDLPNKIGPGPFEKKWGEKVKYGTSVSLARAMNPAYDIMLAYQANGEKLQPDHGFPLRLIIPGFIGGRMIKWIKELNVIPHMTENHYHYHDNRILPPHITAEKAIELGTWYKPEYIFNELNINSAISQPDHNETLGIQSSLKNDYQLAGYAYTGGGRMITRVEITTNGGINWRTCELQRYEKPTDYGMHWCWIWWSFRLPVVEFIGCKEVWCRAWDESNNVQPTAPTWNLMGMGNNQCFRVKIHSDVTAEGEAVFRFEHPTQPGQHTGGWMTTLAGKPESAGFGRLLEQGDLETMSAPAPPPPKAGAKKFTMAEIAKHNEEEDVWIVVNDRVYDCTEYLELHPGGADSILINGGQDSTEDFVAIHSEKATKMLEKFYIGELDKSTAGTEKKPEEDELIDEKTGRKLALHPKKKVTLKVQEKVKLSHDSFMINFALQSPEHMLGLPTGKHVFLSAKIKGETVMRRYTPISSNFDLGCIKFVIKAYPPMPPRFPIGGKMSQHLDSLEVGDSIDIKGPVGEFDYSAKGHFKIDHESHFATKFNMLSGGTGITPCMQIAAEILRNPEDPTLVSLIFACRNVDDLLMRETLDEWALKHPDRFRVHYILSDSWPEDWAFSTGFVNKDLFEKELYPPGDDVYNLMCGPPIMLSKGCQPALQELRHTRKSMFSF
mmetsp:Transcript_4811/g.9506  ORF Transcript_4811/g.9506 Transcript_4811/m.9506 type:complete len:899 (-) Transcript_4811:321-3017(-)|eukprot:CAMPEP_0113303744 /NCGR_PEP_ID=MMETSP0010_2-20120614/4033_1 /TAXON_ID=216773 ORGANISM="Corethron hystrix, Strain 308" /NCGR_SAMPLE_ID=MMETSP0010_2 /ASSEMBLY_ACC=CAM_ASM_000155 /LENGTH=898 /DNA_ID=CAMNT_0000157793 /DNA_START=265 /DNA_END=2961 /DNA_ORIENTATION=+ /assembly_acc=CAM_ASM_000155